MKVKFGLKNAYYAKATASGDSVSYATPVRLPGAVSLSLAAAGEETEFYADDTEYFTDKDNNGYDGSIELAMVPKSFRKDILGESEDSNGVLVENKNNVNSAFALLCEFTTDDGAKKFCFYNCMATRPNQDSSTKGASKEVKTETLNIKIRPRYDGQVKANTDADTNATVLSGWYNSVYEETPLPSA